MFTNHNRPTRTTQLNIGCANFHRFITSVLIIPYMLDFGIFMTPKSIATTYKDYIFKNGIFKRDQYLEYNNLNNKILTEN